MNRASIMRSPKEYSDSPFNRALQKKAAEVSMEAIEFNNFYPVNMGLGANFVNQQSNNLKKYMSATKQLYEGEQEQQQQQSKQGENINISVNQKQPELSAEQQRIVERGTQHGSLQEAMKQRLDTIAKNLRESINDQDKYGKKDINDYIDEAINQLGKIYDEYSEFAASDDELEKMHSQYLLSKNELENIGRRLFEKLRFQQKEEASVNKKPMQKLNKVQMSMDEEFMQILAPLTSFSQRFTPNTPDYLQLQQARNAEVKNNAQQKIDPLEQDQVSKKYKTDEGKVINTVSPFRQYDFGKSEVAVTKGLMTLSSDIQLQDKIAHILGIKDLPSDARQDIIMHLIGFVTGACYGNTLQLQSVYNALNRLKQGHYNLQSIGEILGNIVSKSVIINDGNQGLNNFAANQLVQIIFDEVGGSPDHLMNIFINLFSFFGFEYNVTMQFLYAIFNELGGMDEEGVSKNSGILEKMMSTLTRQANQGAAAYQDRITKIMKDFSARMDYSNDSNVKITENGAIVHGSH